MSHPAIVPGLGTLLKLSISSVLTTIAQRVTIKGPSMSVGLAPTTNLDSASVTDRPTLPDGGTLDFTAFYDPQDPTHLAIYALIATPAIASWSLVFADVGATTLPFSGVLTKFEPNGMEADGNLGFDASIKINGVPVHTP
jgi:hypothetical protein